MYHIIPLCCVCLKTHKYLHKLTEKDVEILDMLSTQIFAFENLKSELPLYMCSNCLKQLEKIKCFLSLFNASITQIIGYVEQLKYEEYYCIPVIKIDTEQHIKNIQNDFIIRNQPIVLVEKISDDQSKNAEIIEISCDVQIHESENIQINKLINDSETIENVKNIWDKLLAIETNDSAQNEDPLSDIFDKRIGHYPPKNKLETNVCAINKRQQSSNVQNSENKRQRSTVVLTRQREDPPPASLLIDNIKNNFACILNKHEETEHLDIKIEPFDEDIIIDESNIKKEIYYE